MPRAVTQTVQAMTKTPALGAGVKNCYHQRSDIKFFPQTSHENIIHSIHHFNGWYKYKALTARVGFCARSEQ